MKKHSCQWLQKTAELLLLKTTGWANEEISWYKELLLECPWCNQYIGLSCASLCIIQLCWWPQEAPIFNKQKAWVCFYFISKGSKETEGAFRFNCHLHSESILWKWYKFISCNPTVVDRTSTQLIYWRLKMPINHAPSSSKEAKPLEGVQGCRAHSCAAEARLLCWAVRIGWLSSLSQTHCSCAQVSWAD